MILFGLGPLAGTFGIAAYTVGYLAKIYADFFEGTDPEIMEAVGSTPEELAALVKSDIARLGKLIREAGIRE